MEQGEIIPLTINAASNSVNEVLTITVANLPAGARLSAGTNNGNTWTLTEEQLAGLTLTLPEDFKGTLNLQVTAISIDGNTEKRLTLTLTINVKNSFVLPTVEPSKETITTIKEDIRNEGTTELRVTETEESKILVDAGQQAFDSTHDQLELISNILVTSSTLPENNGVAGILDQLNLGLETNARILKILESTQLSPEEELFIKGLDINLQNKIQQELKEEDKEEKEDVSFLVDEEALLEVAMNEDIETFTQKDLDQLPSLEDGLISSFDCFS